MTWLTTILAILISTAPAGASFVNPALRADGGGVHGDPKNLKVHILNKFPAQDEVEQILYDLALTSPFAREQAASMLSAFKVCVPLVANITSEHDAIIVLNEKGGCQVVYSFKFYYNANDYRQFINTTIHEALHYALGANKFDDSIDATINVSLDELTVEAMTVALINKDFRRFSQLASGWNFRAPIGIALTDYGLAPVEPRRKHY